MAHKAVSPRIHDLVDVDAPVKRVATGFGFTEGPIWHPIEQHLTFSDIPGDVLHCWSADSQAAEVARPSHKSNGLTYDANLNLIACEHATSTVSRFTPDGAREVLCSHFEGRELNSPNDVVVAANGTIYFTDPTYGRITERFGVLRPMALDFQGVFMLPPDHKPGDEPVLVCERDVFKQPNGLTLSPCEKWMWVNDSDQNMVRKYTVADDGQLIDGALFADNIKEDDRLGQPDGMKADAEGNLYVTAPGGVWVFDFNGEKLGEISVPEKTANFHWGGVNWDTLYFTASTSIYAMKIKAKPHPEAFMAAGA